MRTKKVKKIVSLFLAVLMCVTIFAGFGTTAYAAEETDEVYLISFPRDGDDNYGGEWGHGSHEFMNGWSTDTSRYTSVYAMGSYNGNICYCIEIGVPLKTGDRFTKKGENFWDNYPSSYNKTISPDDIKLFIGRIMQYGYTGTISTSWRSQNEGGDKLAHAVATQLLIWETVVGERDADFNKVDTGGKDAILDQISVNHPLRSKIMSYYNSITASVQNHSKVNYPVMYTPESPQKYLRRNFDGGYSQSGIPFLDYRCDTGCTNRMIYGHNMKNRTMFGTLIHYTDPAYAAAHSVITFQTADGLEKYTVFAVVPVQKTDAWYSFIRAADGAEFAKQVALLRSKSLYDTGVTPVYGQQLLTLSTCYGSGKDGRLIVAAAQL